MLPVVGTRRLPPIDFLKNQLRSSCGALENGVFMPPAHGLELWEPRLSEEKTYHLLAF